MDQFHAAYRNSEEEKRDVLAAYEKNQGDMDAVLGEVMCSEVDDVPRFEAIIREAIAEGRAKEHAKLAKSTSANVHKRRKRKAAQEQREQQSAGSFDDLVAQISKNRAAREQRSAEMFEQFEANAKAKTKRRITRN